MVTWPQTSLGGKMPPKKTGPTALPHWFSSLPVPPPTWEPSHPGVDRCSVSLEWDWLVPQLETSGHLSRWCFSIVNLTFVCFQGFSCGEGNHLYPPLLRRSVRTATNEAFHRQNINLRPLILIFLCDCSLWSLSTWETKQHSWHLWKKKWVSGRLLMKNPPLQEAPWCKVKPTRLIVYSLEKRCRRDSDGGEELQSRAVAQGASTGSHGSLCGFTVDPRT